jgi:hypothetical protein
VARKIAMTRDDFAMNSSRPGMTSSRPIASPEAWHRLKCLVAWPYLRMGHSYFGADGIAEEWWSTINQASPRFT